MDGAGPDPTLQRWTEVERQLSALLSGRKAGVNYAEDVVVDRVSRALARLRQRWDGRC